MDIKFGHVIYAHGGGGGDGGDGGGDDDDDWVLAN